MIDKNEVMKDAIKYFTELVNCSSGEIKENYKDMVKDLMATIGRRDKKLYEECQKIINDTNNDYMKD